MVYGPPDYRHCVARRKGFGLVLSVLTLGLGYGPLGLAQEEVWVGRTSGNWSVGSNWLDGSPPPSAGGSALSLRFAAPTAGPITSTQNLSSGFVVNQLLFDQTAGRSLNLSSLSSITLSGDSPDIVQDGLGSITISAPLRLSGTDGPVTISGAGAGSITLSGRLSNSGTGEVLRIEGSNASPNGSLISLTASNSLTGTVTVQSGNVSFNPASLGQSTLRVNGGMVRFEDEYATIPNRIELNSDLVIVGRTAHTLSGVISSTTAGAGLHLRAATGQWGAIGWMVPPRPQLGIRR